MENKKEQNVNPNNQLESVQKDTKQLVAKAFMAIGLLLFLFIIVWFVKASRGTDDGTSNDEPNNSLIDSVKNEKDFTFYAEPKTDDEIIEILPSRNGADSANGGGGSYGNGGYYGGNGGSESFGSNGSSNSNYGGGNYGSENYGGGGSNVTPFQAQMQTSIKPRIIKGMSAAVLPTSDTNPSDSSDSGSKYTANNTISIDDKSGLEKLLEAEAANGGMQIPSLDDIIEKVTSNLPIDVDEFGNVIPKKKEEGSFNGEVFQPTSAYFSEFNQTLLLPKGSFIPCSLKTRIVSELKGGIACIVANNVYSANGQTLLIEKGSTITGTYTNADINDATTRLYVIWEEIKTPLNIVIPISSGGSDTLGGSGVEGTLDNHYVERFGAAIMLSVIDGGIKILGNYVKNLMSNNDDIQFNEASNMASMVMRKTMNIKPTLYRNHGDLVGVYVNKDVDFSKVYRLRRKK